MDVDEALRLYANRPRSIVLERVKEFLGIYVHDCDGWEDLREQLTSTSRDLRPYADALTVLLNEPQPAGTLSYIVAVDANWSLDDGGSDTDAAAALAEIAEILHAVINRPE
ncbi:hypothetical protein ACFXHA_01175 [Nocardia sp. NPDC059240]|uniref:hypothetical protein n=1 Tax=Nocardia sp. NPDC059240 TaxID=3346786 RepID=UPI003675BB54